MKRIFLFLTAGLMLAGCAKHEKPAAEEEKAEAPWKVSQNASGENVVTLNEETLVRVGVKTEAPPASQWVPEVKGYGMVVDTALLATAMADLETARGVAVISSNEFARLTTLAAQGNASARAVEAAEAASRRDALAHNAARARFALDWGNQLADHGLPAAGSLVRVVLPMGQAVSAKSARIATLAQETDFVTADFFDNAGLDPQTQQQRLLFVTTNTMTPGTAITAGIKLDQAPQSGITVPVDAIVRYQGETWFYAETGEREFTRHRITLASPDGAGWFISDTSRTNPVVVTGAQALLSTELSAAGFSTGERD